MTDLKHYERLRDNFTELIRIHKLLDDQLGENGNVTFILYHEKIVLSFDNLGVLSNLRKATKTIYPNWTDKINNVWQGAGDMITSWQSKQHPLLQFWFECPANDYPASLLKKGCKIITEEHTTKESSLVCSI